MMEICEDCKHRDECSVPTRGMELDCRARRIMSANVCRLRNERDLSQRELARRAGIDRSYLARLENEALNISINVVFALAKTFDVHPCEILEEENPEEVSAAE